MQVFWPKVVLKKLLKIPGDDADFSADEGDNESEIDEDGYYFIVILVLTILVSLRFLLILEILL
jgi:hypothetical protein